MAEQEQGQGSVLPACGACGAQAGWVISSAAPVYVTVEPEGRVSRVRVNDEALSLGFNAPDTSWPPSKQSRSMVTCRACDVEPPQKVAAAVREAAQAADSWPSWELGA